MSYLGDGNDGGIDGVIEGLKETRRVEMEGNVKRKLTVYIVRSTVSAGRTCLNGNFTFGETRMGSTDVRYQSSQPQ